VDLLREAGMPGPDISIHAFIVSVLFWAALVILCLGLGMVAVPRHILRLGQKLNRWISTDKFFQKLDTPRYGERFFYRHHLLFGSFIILGGAYIFYRFVFVFGSDTYVLPVFTSGNANQWLTASLVFMNILFGTLAFIFGLIVILRPSLLKRVEAGLNRWIVTEDSVKRLDRQLQSPDSVFISHPRLMGLIIVGGCMYIVVNLWSML